MACIKQQEWKEEVSEEQDDAKLPSGVFVCKKGEYVGKKKSTLPLKTKLKKNWEGKCRTEWVVAQR